MRLGDDRAQQLTVWPGDEIVENGDIRILLARRLNFSRQLVSRTARADRKETAREDCSQPNQRGFHTPLDP